MPNFSSVALFVQKLFRWGNFTPPQLFNVHKKPNWERVNTFISLKTFATYRDSHAKQKSGINVH